MYYIFICELRLYVILKTVYAIQSDGSYLMFLSSLSISQFVSNQELIKRYDIFLYYIKLYNLRK